MKMSTNISQNVVKDFLSYAKMHLMKILTVSKHDVKIIHY